MKRMIKFGLALFFTVFVAPVWAHHAAEGIISDDVWAMIDEQLTLADSPHLDIDFEDIMGSMRVGSDPDSGSNVLITYMDVVPEDAETLLDVMEDVMAILENPGDVNVPSGVSSDGNTGALMWDMVELDDGNFQLVIIEPIGNTTYAESGDTNQNGQRAGG